MGRRAEARARDLVSALTEARQPHSYRLWSGLVVALAALSTYGCAHWFMVSDGYVRVYGRVMESLDGVGLVRADPNETAVAQAGSPVAGCTVAVEARVLNASREVVGRAIGSSNAQGCFDLLVTRELGPHDVAFAATCPGRIEVAGVVQQHASVTWAAVYVPQGGGALEASPRGDRGTAWPSACIRSAPGRRCS